MAQEHTQHAVTGAAKPGHSCLLRLGFVSWSHEERWQAQSSGAEVRSSVAESHLLLIVGTISLLIFAIGMKTLPTPSAHPPSIKPHLHGVYPIPVYCGPSYVHSFLQPV